MLIFPDPSVETEYTDPNGSVWEFNGTGWVRQCDCSGSGGGSGDPNWGSVELLINGEEGLTDSTGKNTIVVNGDVSTSNSEVKYGAGSVDLTQTGGYLSVENPTHLDAPFTIECWFWPPNSAITTLLADYSNADRGWTVQTTNGVNGMLFVLSHDGAGTAKQLTSLGQLPDLNAWNHVALTWDGSVYRSFLNGRFCDRYESALPLYRPSGDLTIGARYVSSGYGQFFDGYLDDIRITKGVCLYTGDYEPPLEHTTSRAKTIYKSVDLTQIQEDSNDADLSDLTNDVTTEE